VTARRPTTGAPRHGKDIIKLFDKFQSFTICSPKRGNTTLFWTNIWAGEVLKDTYPQLFSFTEKPNAPSDFSLTRKLADFLAFLFLHRLQHNWKRFRLSCKRGCGMKILMTSGTTLGGHQCSAARKHTISLLETQKHPHSSHGYGLQVT
jgi:hypothetical protein